MFGEGFSMLGSLIKLGVSPIHLELCRRVGIPIRIEYDSHCIRVDSKAGLIFITNRDFYG